MEFRRSSFNFASAKGGVHTAEQTLVFPRGVRQVAVGMIGYSASFDNGDHHLGLFMVKLRANIQAGDNTRVNVTGLLGLRDWSGVFDDYYSGNVQWIIIADLEPATNTGEGGVRTDLMIVDAEVTQVVQHFRSSEHLNAINVFPDNSIRLVANKPTLVRLYTDYDRNSGLTPILGLSGEIEVTSRGMTRVISATRSIVPIRDNNINRGVLEHTLNFQIPEELCRGRVNFRARIFDSRDNTQFSRDFEKTVVFETFPVLPIIAVGVNYTGKDVKDGAAETTLSAPALSDFVDVFQFTEKVYPIPSVTISNYYTIDYDKDIESDINDGCDKFGDLLDVIDDFRGDSNDIVYGMVNSGVNTGTVGGCGRSGVVAGIIGGQRTAAHEIGHGLGRNHAPCDNVIRCFTPANTDDDYPRYDGYNSDSIGEYGVDPLRPVLKSPSTQHDFMGYSSPNWVSPYTYKALMNVIPMSFSRATAMLTTASFFEKQMYSVDNEWIAQKTPHLFARIDIDVDKNVKFHTSFCYDSLPRTQGDKKTKFLLSFIDSTGKNIRTVPLYADTGCAACGCQEQLSPLSIRQAIPFPKDAKEIVITECKKEVFRTQLAKSPKVKVVCKGGDNKQEEQILLEWSIESNEKNCLSLVQWQDDSGTWRGVAPRTAKQYIEIPKRIFKKQKYIKLRVLVSSGVVTGQGVWEGKCIYPQTNNQKDNEFDVKLVGVDLSKKKTVNIPAILKAVPVNNESMTHLLPEIRWYNEKGGEISKGATINLNILPYGENYITAAVLETGQGSGARQWLIERTKDNQYLLRQGTIDRKKPC